MATSNEGGNGRNSGLDESGLPEGVDDGNFLNSPANIVGIILQYLPETIDSYLAVPKRLRGQAEDPARESIDLLWAEAKTIQDAIGQDNLNALRGQRDTLALQFGKLKDYESGSETP